MYEIGRLIVTCHYVRSFIDIQTSLTPKLKGCIVKGKLLLCVQDIERRYNFELNKAVPCPAWLGMVSYDLGRGINIHEIFLSAVFYLQTAQKRKKSKVCQDRPTNRPNDRQTDRPTR